MMLNNFIYAETKDLFLTQLNAGNILDEAIVFIEDTKEIWNRGHYFGGDVSSSGSEGIVVDFDVMGSPINSTDDSNYYSQSQLELGVGMSVAELFDKLSTQNLVIKLDTTRFGNPYYIVFDGEFYGAQYYAGIGTIYTLNIRKTPVDGASMQLAMQDVLSSQLAQKQDVLVSGTNIKTVNGESLLGEGNIELGGNKSSQVVLHSSSETIVTLTPDVIHTWDEVDSLQLTIPEDNELEENHYKVVFIPNEDFSLTMPSSIRWEGGETPTFDLGYQYELSLQGNRCLSAQFKLPPVRGTYLEYIENSGSDWIITDYVVSSKDYGYEVKTLMNGAVDTYGAICGCAQTGTITDTNFTVWVTPSTGKSFVYWNGTNSTLLSSGSIDGQVHTFSEPSKGANSATINTSSYPLAIFNQNSSSISSISRVFYGRIYYVKLFGLGGSLNLDLHPFKRSSDGVIGMIDNVTGKFYTSINGNLTEPA